MALADEDSTLLKGLRRKRKRKTKKDLLCFKFWYKYTCLKENSEWELNDEPRDIFHMLKMILHLVKLFWSLMTFQIQGKLIICKAIIHSK